METDHTKLDKDEHHHQLSGAYIRSLVKQLSSSRTKDLMDPRDPDHCVAAAADGGAKSGQVLDNTQQTQQPQKPQQHKKQVRRRLHTSRPYQERLMNMAEARKEIVTALKYHRASMKQAQEKQQQPQPQPEQSLSPPPPTPPLLLQPPPGPCFEPETTRKSRRNQRVYPSNTANFTNYAWPPPNHLPWQAPQIAPPLVTDNLNFTLPNQPLGLNLNFHDFSNLDTNLYRHSYTNPSASSIYSSDYSSPSSSSSPPLPIATQYSPSVEMSQDVLHHHHNPVPVSSDLTDSSGGMHPSMDDKEMAEIRSIGEKHEMEWTDTVNLVTSAWWSKFLKSEGEEMMGEHNPFDEVMQFPTWLNPNESLGLQQLHYSDDCSQIPALPCLDFGDFEGMDEEWLPYKD